MSNFNIEDMLKETYQRMEKNPWIDSPYEKINLLTNDTRGKLGEQILSKVFHNIPCHIDQDISDNSIHEDGHYDLKVDNLRIEVKTSANIKMWQHEPLYTEEFCDLVVFLDFTPDSYYVSFLRTTDLPLGNESNFFPNKHGHLRPNKNTGYKLDFSNKTFKDLMKMGVCKNFRPGEEKALIDFIDSLWSDYCV
jgi:hypothetical protein